MSTTISPGFVECAFVDADGRRHLFVEKVPVLTTEALQADSAYPRPGIIACEVEAEWADENGQRRVRINTERPWGVESSDGLASFVVVRSQFSAAA